MNTKLQRPKFLPGQTVATPGALEAIEESGQEPCFFLDRHITGDWGGICEEDRGLNDQSLIDGSRILSVYKTLLGVAIWIITEADRSSTTILLPSEY